MWGPTAPGCAALSSTFLCDPLESFLGLPFRLCVQDRPMGLTAGEVCDTTIELHHRASGRLVAVGARHGDDHVRRR